MAKPSLKSLKAKAAAVDEVFAAAYPDAGCALEFMDPLQCLVSTILSAQTTDKSVNKVTPALFKKFPSVNAFARAKPEEIEPFIRTLGLFRAKAKNIVGTAQMLRDAFGGVVPDTIEELVKLPGVGRKTANVVGAVIFGKHVMAVDTHVFRVSARIGLTKNAKTPLQTELQLTKNIPYELLPQAHHWLILHGRYICTARKPHCDKCGIKEYCRYFAHQEKSKAK